MTFWMYIIGISITFSLGAWNVAFLMGDDVDYYERENAMVGAILAALFWPVVLPFYGPYVIIKSLKKYWKK